MWRQVNLSLICLNKQDCEQMNFPIEKSHLAPKGTSLVGDEKRKLIFLC